MSENRLNMSILNELSEYIHLRMSSYLEQTHDHDWTEHKSHPDYDLWFIQEGSVKMMIDGFEYTAVRRCHILLSGYALYRLVVREQLPIHIHPFRFWHRGSSEFWADFNFRELCRAI